MSMLEHFHNVVAHHTSYPQLDRWVDRQTDRQTDGSGQDMPVQEKAFPRVM